MPISILLIPYVLFLTFFAVVALAAIYHVVRFGFVTPVTIGVSVLFLALTGIVLWVSVGVMNGIDWSQTFTISTALYENEAPRSSAARYLCGMLPKANPPSPSADGFGRVILLAFIPATSFGVFGEGE